MIGATFAAPGLGIALYFQDFPGKTLKTIELLERIGLHFVSGHSCKLLIPRGLLLDACRDLRKFLKTLDLITKY